MEKMKPRIRSLNDLFANEEVQPYPNEVSAPAVQTADEKNGLQFIAPKKIRTFLNHPFRLYDGERLDDLVESVKANGILIPTIVRKIEKDENGYEYEMLAGHNRQNAAIIADLEVIPCIVKENITDEEAWIYVIETNVMQRSFTDMLPSEKAAVLALRYSKMFSQGKRNDIIEELKRLENPDYIRENSTCGSDCHKLKNRDKVGAEYSLSGRSNYDFGLGDSDIGNITRIENAVDGISNLLAKENKDLANLERQLETAKGEYGQPFIYEAELAEKSAKLTEIDTELELGKGDEDTVIDDSENGDNENSEFEPVAVSVGEEV